MNAKKCDRCGKLYEEKISDVDIKKPFRYEITRDEHPHPVVTKIDLCKNCKEDFIKWLEGKNGGAEDATD